MRLYHELAQTILESSHAKYGEEMRRRALAIEQTSRKLALLALTLGKPNLAQLNSEFDLADPDAPYAPGRIARQQAQAIRELALSLERRFGKPDIPQRGETLAIAISNPRTAALFFDRVWWMPALEGAPPKSISFYGATPAEAALGVFAAMLSGEKEAANRVFLWAHSHNIISDSWENIRQKKWMPIQICKSIYEEYGLHSAPLYPSREIMDEDLASGERQVLIFAMEGIPIISEADLEWQQVVELRADKENRIKLKRLLGWARAGISANKTPEEIRDEIEIRLDDYKYALRKHGLKSVVGVLSSVLDPKGRRRNNSRFSGRP